jgi:hypothetical protein
VEDRTSGLQDNVDIIEKSAEYLEERMKTCEQNLYDSIKRSNLCVIDIEE